MRTIIVVFTDRKVSLNEVSSYKKYKFLCNYDTISLYDAVKILGKRVKSLFD